ncbi:hypothetical protein [uncultured Methylobacterium sp.]|uniref:hypothetical protein n=1 Tax=uncultured Methylobacterium sp. TaxID=157278 RepID=UPI0035CC58C4
MTVASFSNEVLGANIRSVDTASVAGSGTPAPQFKLGWVTTGDAGSEFVYVAITLTAGQTLTDGQLVQYDNNYTASLVTTANAIRGASVGVVRVSPAFVAPAAGTFYVWAQRCGIAPVAAAATAVGNTLAETTATAGTAGAPASPTVGSKLISGLYFAATSQTFAGTAAVGSTLITGVNLSTLTTGLFVGQAVSGTGIPGGATIAAIYAGQGNSFPLGGTPPVSPGSPTNATIVLSAAATAAGTPTITATGILEAYVNWPYLDKTN